MALPLITNPLVTTKKRSWNLLKEIEKESVSAYAYKDEIRCGYRPVKIGELSESVEKLYRIDGGFIAFTSDGKFEKILGDRREKIHGLWLDKAPIITEVTYNGEKRIMAIIKDKCLFLDGDREYLNIFNGHDYVQVGLNLFAVHKQGIVFANLNEYLKNQNQSAVSYVGITGEKSILKIVGQKNRLLIFTEDAVYSLAISQSESVFALTKEYSHDCKIKNNSVVGMGEKVYFLDEKGRVLYFSDNSVKSVCNAYKYGLEVKGGYAHLDSVVYDMGEYAVYVNVEKNAVYKIETKGLKFVDGEFFVDALNGEIYRLQKDGGKLSTRQIFLSKNARLEWIKFNASTPTSISIFGRFGTKKIFVGKGVVAVKLNLYSDSFAFTFEFEKDGVIEDLEIEYS